MELVDVLHRYLSRFKAEYGRTITSEQWSALNAMLGCRSGQYGQIALSCPDCEWHGYMPQSCGHRACEQCQHHTTAQWLERQQGKLLPVRYFMVTFTLPFELRGLAKNNAALVYRAMFQAASATLKSFGLNDKHFNSTLGMTGVLHTHSRRLDYHPHIHFIVPAGGFHAGRREWRKRNGRYLFKQASLAKVFRARLLTELRQDKLALPQTPRLWVVDCQAVGRGLPALKYLARYLYRGVLSHKNLVSDDGEFVTFRYKDSKTGTWQQRCLRGQDFVALLLQHVLPKGFRRTRDYGFLHGNSKRVFQQLQLVLRVAIPVFMPRQRPAFTCRHCRSRLRIAGFSKPRLLSG